MLTSQYYLNKPIINKNNESGVLVSIDDEHTIIKYEDREETYNTSIAFKSGFLSFVDQELQTSITQVLNEKDAKQKAKEELANKNTKTCINRFKKIDETYKRLCEKNSVLLTLFGGDFIYPPLKEFEEKYRFLIDKSRKYKDIRYFDSNKRYYSYNYYL